ncbi:globoside alpha-1,3-N-acetylgalactosaminyltransferase 1-like [Denticeps clupeoides]|uniref:Globoside alpha-1,3-N-acetylgalactosaminyltransferase 1 n=1 Tax=Denticeps clupeoides TaxID=299321 RepID=A0AAY4AXD6_9TELE|nr:globoside alpha-1,3-N-acetylgalactosaminyltransferase 1-like [Denticeps clupeoides]
MRFFSSLYPLAFIMVSGVIALFYVSHTTLTSWFRRDVCFSQPSITFVELPSEMHMSERVQYKQPSVLHGRSDVASVTPWLAPIVWKDTYDPVVFDHIYKNRNLTIATTVFAVGKYILFMHDFLETAEKYFMVGFNVHYYIFTDNPKAVPEVKFSPGRVKTIIEVPGSKRWQEISSRRMEMIQKTIEEHIKDEADYIFCLDVDTKFYDYWGPESLGTLVACLHPGYYEQQRESFPYERRSASTAYIPNNEGDYYYGGAVIGGLVGEVHKVAKTCRENLELDASKSIEAAWQEESHLNRYFLYNKPTKVLSPEYLWQDFKAKTKEIRTIRFSQVIKNYAEVRPNQ